MRTVNSLSGGKSSSYMAVKYPADYDVFSLVCIDDEECKPKDGSIINYVNEKLEKFIPEYGEFIATAEDDQTLYVMRDLEQHLGKEIIWVRGKSFDDVIDEGTKTRLPSWARRYCTEQMKLWPIFKWWFQNIGEKVEMRIGFRHDEFDRMINYFNNSDPTRYSIPIRTRMYGQKRQIFEEFIWRFCTMPMVKDSVGQEIVNEYWDNGYQYDGLFSIEILFPIISNCVGCFHKKKQTIATMAELNTSKIKWFSKQETKGKGTWHDDKVTYEEIMNNRLAIAKEFLIEGRKGIPLCDSGGCTD